MVSETDSLGLLSYQPKNAKSAIIQKLSKQFPLTTKQLSNAIQHEYGLEITYQAVHKAVLELEKDHILCKEKNQWKIDSAWLQHHERFIQQTLQKYQGNKNKYNIDLNFRGTQQFEFDNLTDFYVETAKLVAHNVLCKNQEPAYWILEYGWWTPKFKFEHLELLLKLSISAPKTGYIIRTPTPFGKWVSGQYARVGGIGKVGINFPVEDDFLIQGDWVGQFHTSDEGKKLIEKLWNKWKNLEDCFREFGLKNEPKTRVIATITYNPTLANFMRKQFDKYLDGEK